MEKQILKFIFYLILTISCLDSISVKVEIPERVIEGSDAILYCLYDIGDSKLYAVKWFVWNLEIYRYMPEDRPNKQYYTLNRINVDLEKSDDKNLYLKNLTSTNTGIYRCEVSIEGTFQTASKEGRIQVVAKPINETHIPVVENLDQLTPAYLVQTGQTIDLKHYPIGKSPVTYLVNYTDVKTNETLVVNKTHIPVVIGADEGSIPFNLTNYFNQLETRDFGRNLIVGDNLPTTMDIGHDFGTIHGLVIIANMQTRSRASPETNPEKWVSPRGDIYMNINLRLTDQSRAGLLPAYCALSLIKAVQSTPIGNYSKLPIRFLWPISITWMPWNKKIGGVLVESIISNENNWFTSGCGLRVNSHLTYSLSKMIDEYNCKNPTKKLPQLDIPGLIARAVNYLEKYFDLLESDPDSFIKLIMDNWVNDRQKVVINVETEIVGLKSDGSLILKDTANSFYI